MAQLHFAPATTARGPNRSVVRTAIWKDICGGEAFAVARRRVSSSSFAPMSKSLGPSQLVAAGRRTVDAWAGLTGVSAMPAPWY
jgi:hypothetical protein